MHLQDRTRKRPKCVCYFLCSPVGSPALWAMGSPAPALCPIPVSPGASDGESVVDSKARSKVLGLLLRRNGETSLDLEVFCVTWGAIRAICHWHRVKWKVYACVFFILQLSARHTLLSCKGKKSTRTHACLSLELSRISLSWIVKLMCSCRNCCQLLPRCCLMAK